MTSDLPAISPIEIESIKNILSSVLIGTMVEVITDNPGIKPNGLIGILSPAELTKASGYTNEKRRTEYLNGRYAIKMLLSKCLPLNTPLHLITVDNDHNGAPFLRMKDNSSLVQPSLPHPSPVLTSSIISLTHKAQVILAVLGTEPTIRGIGVDLEYRTTQKNIEKAKDRMIELIGNSAESDLIEQELIKIRDRTNYPENSPIHTDPFLALFSIKEAAFKVLRGEASNLKKINLESIGPYNSSQNTLTCFRSTLQYHGQSIEAITIELTYFLISMAWF